MFRHHSHGSRPLLAAVAGGIALLAFGTGPACGQSTLVDFNFTGNNGTANPVNATTVATGLTTPVQITRVGPNMAAQSHANSFLGNNWPLIASPVANQDYFSFTIAAQTGLRIDLSSGGMSLEVAINKNGPGELVVRSSLDNFATNIAAPYTPTVNLTQDTFAFAPYLSAIGITSPVSGPIEFRMYGYQAGKTNKQLWLGSTTAVPNAVQVTGGTTPVPEPAWLLSAATLAAGLSWRSRQTRRSPSVAQSLA